MPNDDPPPQRPSDRACVDCGEPSPDTEGSHTLISSRHGWRITRALRPDGRRIMEWRCPLCWGRYESSVSQPPAQQGAPAASQDTSKNPFQKP